MKIAVCDDNQEELHRVASLLEDYQEEKTVSISLRLFGSSVELASIAQQENFDLYLLDVLMPALNGMELAREIRTFNTAVPILFLTSSPEFAVESYTVHAANYLLKPVSRESLFSALNDISAQQKADRKNYIIVKSNIGVRKILLSQLVYVEAQDRRVIYYLQSGEQVECLARFSTIAGELLKNIEFIQPHRSYLVNMSYINIIGTMDMELQDHTVLPLAQRRVAEIKEYYLAYQMGEIMP